VAITEAEVATHVIRRAHLEAREQVQQLSRRPLRSGAGGSLFLLVIELFVMLMEFSRDDALLKQTRQLVDVSVAEGACVAEDLLVLPAGEAVSSLSIVAMATQLGGKGFEIP